MFETEVYDGLELALTPSVDWIEKQRYDVFDLISWDWVGMKDSFFESRDDKR